MTGIRVAPSPITATLKRIKAYLVTLTLLKSSRPNGLT